MAPPKIIQMARLVYNDRTYQSTPFDNSGVIALRPMLLRMLAKYGLNATSSRRDIAFAIRDFVARTMVHPNRPFHPNGSTANLTVLPPGETWTTYNNTMNAGTRANDENLYWGTLGFDALSGLITKLYGTLNRSTGVLADDGMLTEYAPGQWRMRSLATLKSTQCSYMDLVQHVFLAAFGIPGMLVSTRGHDGCASFIVDDDNAIGNDLGWTWNDPTYNETFLLDGVGQPLSPLALHYYSLGGAASMLRLKPQRITGPSHDPAVYNPAIPTTDTTYFSGNAGHPDGMNVIGMATSVNTAIDTPIPSQRANNVQLDTRGLGLASATVFRDQVSYPRTDAHVVFPYLGTLITRWSPSASGVSFRLGSTWPGPGVHTFEKRVNGGAWVALGTTGDTLTTGTGTVEYRPVDTLGFRGGRAIIKL